MLSVYINELIYFLREEPHKNGHFLWGTAIQEIGYRIEISVRQSRFYGIDRYPICPRCGISLEREFMKFCNNCGQKLGWDKYTVDDE